MEDKKYPKIKMVVVQPKATKKVLKENSRAAFYENEDYEYIKKTFIELAKK